jgi:hypothetical protein
MADGDLPPSHGFLAEGELHRLRRQAVADVLRPAAAALVDERGSSAGREFSGARGNAVLRGGATYLST